jgi:hypothetical protein
MEIDQGNEKAKIFIRTYYPIMIYQPAEVYKFYDENALIWRPSFKETNGLRISQCISEVPIRLNPTDQFVVSTYVVNDLRTCFYVSVTGYIRTKTTITAFVHSFVFQFNFSIQRLFIISDAFHLFEPNKIMQLAEHNVQVGAINQEMLFDVPNERTAPAQEPIQEFHENQQKERRYPVPQGRKQPNPSSVPTKKQNFYKKY